MQPLSVFDMFKIGVGPSSSHTMGPWLAASRFLRELPVGTLPQIEHVGVDLYGSLAKTGKGHGTDVALQLGFAGHHPKSIVVEQIDEILAEIAATKRLNLLGEAEVRFDAKTDIRFRMKEQLLEHPNGMRFSARLIDGSELSGAFYSVGGGFVVREGEMDEPRRLELVELPFPIDTNRELMGHCEREGLSISQIVRRNELAWRSEAEMLERLREIRDAMLATVHRGCRTHGVLPGGLGVKRRAARMAQRLLGCDVPEDVEQWLSAIESQPSDFQQVLDWVSCFALATNEENAAFGRVVTAPTNGAAGVIPAVLLYLLCFCKPQEDEWVKFLLTAGEIGCLFKKGATISAALGGCQAEIGVSSSMAAAALTECLGGTAAQATEAAEIAMEHHLGLTCDPIGGLVQIPCIERNAMGAIKAITAARMAIQRVALEARVSLDDVIRTMWQTALDMNEKYKETSEGGLAINIAVNTPEC